MKKVKIVIHVADIHIRTFRLHDEYKEVILNFIKDAKEKIKGYEYDEIRFVIAGDLVHQKITISNEQFILCSWFIKELIKLGKVVLIAGNHDMLVNNKDRVDSLTPLVKLIDSEHLYYLTDSKCYLDESIVWCNYSIFEDNAKPDIASARVNFGNDKQYIGLFHGPLVGATTDIGYEFDHGADIGMFKGCDLVMMGDIHKRDVFYLTETLEKDKITDEMIGYGFTEETDEAFVKKTPIVYSGSLVQQNFGEKVSGHGFAVWDLEAVTVEFSDVLNPNPFYLFEVNDVEDFNNNLEVLVNE